MHIKGLRQTFALNVISACSVTASFSLDIALSAISFFFTIVNKHLFFGDYLVILAAKRRNVQYIEYKYVTSIGRGCSFLICALIGSLKKLPLSLADVTTWFWCYDIQLKSASKRSLFPNRSGNEMIA